MPGREGFGCVDEVETLETGDTSGFNGWRPIDIAPLP